MFSAHYSSIRAIYSMKNTAKKYNDSIVEDLNIL